MSSDLRDATLSDLQHHGIKGMRWGVRKEDVSSGARTVGKAAKSVGKAAVSVGRFAGDVQFESRLNNPDSRNSVNMSINTKARQAFKRTDLPALKERHGDYAKLRNRAKQPFSQEARAYRKDARETYIKRLEDAANSMTNVSGTRQYTIRERGWELPAEGGALPSSKHYWKVTSREIKHADGESTWDLEVIEDGEGYITDLVPVEDAMAQTAERGAAFVTPPGDPAADFLLEHFGVKGMQWGVRKAPPLPVHPSATSKVPHGTLRKTKIEVKGGENHPAHEDAVKVAQAQAKLKKSGTAALSNKELQELQNRLNLENNVTRLARERTTLHKGRKFVKGLTGLNQEVNTAVNTGFQTQRLAKQFR